MQFKVPQFLEIEDKIFGPFTFKQFAYLAGGAGLCYTLFKLLGFFMGFIPIALIASFSLALTFYRPNGKPFLDVVEASIKYVFGDKLYIWKRREIKLEDKEKVEQKRIELQQISKLSGSKLRDLAWSLDVLDAKK